MTITDRIFESTIATLELYSIHLGVELGLYAALGERGALCPAELADATAIDERYAREWLEQQAVADLIDVDTPAADPTIRRYRLATESRAAFLDPVHEDHVVPFTAMAVGIANVLDEVCEAYRSGGGVPYEHYGRDFRHGQGGINRPAFSADLVDSWLPATKGVAELLTDGGRVIDIGCGHGWSTIAMTKRGHRPTSSASTPTPHRSTTPETTPGRRRWIHPSPRSTPHRPPRSDPSTSPSSSSRFTTCQRRLRYCGRFAPR